MKKLLLLSLICGQALAADVTVKVTSPTQRVDGSAMTAADVFGWNFWRATKLDGSDRKYLGQLSPATLVAYTDKAVVAGTYYYFATTIAFAGGESDISNAVKIVIDASKPQPPVITVSVSAP